MKSRFFSLRIGTKETHEIFTLRVGFIGIVQSSRIFFLTQFFNTFPFLYKFESLGFQMQATDKGGRVGDQTHTVKQAK